MLFRSDALCLQELKLTDDKYPHRELEAAGYISISNGQKTYNEQFEYGVTELRKLEFKPNSSYWIYSVKVPRRDDFQRAMKDRGVMTSQVHERNDIHPCVSKYRTELPNLEKVIGELLAYPLAGG